MCKMWKKNDLRTSWNDLGFLQMNVLLQPGINNLSLFFSLTFHLLLFLCSPFGEEGIHTEETELDRNLIELGRCAALSLCRLSFSCILCSSLPGSLSLAHLKSALQFKGWEDSCRPTTAYAARVSRVKMTFQRCFYKYRSPQMGNIDMLL